ncbi:MAG: alcohol dehydrogenase catalytic domain-containing protein [Acidobacteria bacterium]|nr:alcohol dehydrogenase catalytic domain-containing protein [Acidobacteriota bacterium]
MRAVLIDRYGGPEVLRFGEARDPSPGPGEALVRVRTCGVCYHDVLMRQGKYRDVRLPRIIGHEVAGEVACLGPDVSGLEVGDRVLVPTWLSCGVCAHCQERQNELCEAPGRMPGHDEDGGYAELMCAPATCLTRFPESIPWDQAAALPCAAATALEAVRGVAGVKPGDSVLVTGAGGGLGVHATQLSRLHGARVIASTTSKHKAQLLEDLGADHVICGPAEGLAKSVKALTGGTGVTVVIECVGTATFEASLRSLAAEGRMALIGAVSGDTVPIKPAVLVLKDLTISGCSRQARLTDVVDLVVSGSLRPIVSRTLGLNEAAEAHRLLESRESFGRIILQT